jgi:hypothetical protein
MSIRNELEEIIVGSPPDGWSLGHVTVNLLNPEERIPVEAWRRGAFAVHDLSSGGARLTHAPSGLRIWSFRTKDEAVEATEAMEPFTDWTAFTEVLPSGTDLYPKVRKIVDEIDQRESAQ